MQNHVQSATEVRSIFVLVKPDCPVCKTGMRLVQVTPIIFTPDLDEVSYACDECGQRTKRTHKRL
jgi:C4-type Zn-finger protein